MHACILDTLKHQFLLDVHGDSTWPHSFSTLRLVSKLLIDWQVRHLGSSAYPQDLIMPSGPQLCAYMHRKHNHTFALFITDCNQPCQGEGSWNVECTRCECPGNTLTGRVLSTYHTPQAEALIYLARSPYIVINTTDTHGVFVITSACIGQTLLFTKQGYVDEMYLVTTLAEPAQVSLMLIGKLHPIRKYLIALEKLYLWSAVITKKMQSVVTENIANLYLD